MDEALILWVSIEFQKASPDPSAVKGRRFGERQRATAGGWRGLAQVERGKGVPKEREVKSRREVCEWEG